MSQPTSAAITIAAIPAPATINRQRPDEGLDGPLRFQNRRLPLPPDPEGPRGPAGPLGPDGLPYPVVPLGWSAPAPPPWVPPEAGFSGCHMIGSRSEPRTGCGSAAWAPAASRAWAAVARASP